MVQKLNFIHFNSTTNPVLLWQDRPSSTGSFEIFKIEKKHLPQVASFPESDMLVQMVCNAGSQLIARSYGKTVMNATKHP